MKQILIMSSQIDQKKNLNVNCFSGRFPYLRSYGQLQCLTCNQWKIGVSTMFWFAYFLTLSRSFTRGWFQSFVVPITQKKKPLRHEQKICLAFTSFTANFPSIKCVNFSGYYRKNNMWRLFENAWCLIALRDLYVEVAEGFRFPLKYHNVLTQFLLSFAAFKVYIQDCLKQVLCLVIFVPRLLSLLQPFTKLWGLTMYSAS